MILRIVSLNVKNSLVLIKYDVHLLNQSSIIAILFKDNMMYIMTKRSKMKNMAKKNILIMIQFLLISVIVMVEMQFYQL